MLPAGYQFSNPDAMAPWVYRLFESARKRRLQLGPDCGEPEASRGEVAAAAVEEGGL